MTEKRDSNYKALNGYQEQRAEALGVARNVLTASGVFTKGSPEGRDIQELLALAEYVIGDRDTDFPKDAYNGIGIPIPGDAIPGIFSLLGESVPDCGHPECPIHAPRREAQDLNPEDAKSAWDVPWENHGSERLATPDGLPGTLEESDLSGGEADTENEVKQPVRDLPDPNTCAIGQRFIADGKTYQVSASVVPGVKYWKQLP